MILFTLWNIVLERSLAGCAQCMQVGSFCCVSMGSYTANFGQTPALSVRQASLILATVPHTRMTYHLMQIEGICASAFEENKPVSTYHILCIQPS